MALTADDIQLLKEALKPEFEKMKSEIQQDTSTQQPEVKQNVGVDMPMVTPMSSIPSEGSLPKESLPPSPSIEDMMKQMGIPGPQVQQPATPVVPPTVPTPVVSQPVVAPSMTPPAVVAPVVPEISDPNAYNELSEIQSDKPEGDISATSLLAKFAESNFTGMKQVIKFVKEGHKLDNAAMQELLYRLKTKHNMTYRELLSIYLTMDMAVEKGALTNDIIDYLKKNPEMIQKF